LHKKPFNSSELALAAAEALAVLVSCLLRSARMLRRLAV
jgi:hypothetical protein